MVFPAVAVTTLIYRVFAMKDSHNTHRWFRFGRSVYVSTFGVGEAGAGAVPGLFSADADSPDGRLERHDSTGGGCATGIYGADFAGAGPGDGLVCMAVTALMLYLAGARTKYFAIGAALASPVMYYMLFHVKFRHDRMLAFLHPEADPRDRVSYSSVADAVGRVGFVGWG